MSHSLLKRVLVTSDPSIFTRVQCHVPVRASKNETPALDWVSSLFGSDFLRVSGSWNCLCKMTSSNY